MIDPGQVNNYCPISLLFNSIYGSLPGCSSLQKLDILLQAKEHNVVAVVTHLDVHKAFDTVPHHKLIAKLQNFGIPRPGNLYY